MKTRHIITLMATAFALLLVSCDMHTSDNGKLDGMWHLVGVDTLDGGHLDLSNQTKFWMFQSNLMQLSNTNRGELIICRFNQSGDSLAVSEPRVSNRNVGDTLITKPAVLSPYGINALNESFFIEKLQSDKMILRTDRLTLNFKKF